MLTDGVASIVHMCVHVSVATIYFSVVCWTDPDSGPDSRASICSTPKYIHECTFEHQIRLVNSEQFQSAKPVGQ